MTTSFKRVIVSYGSQSGNSQRLAQSLTETAFSTTLHLELVALNHLDPHTIDDDDLLLVITSTFGDGEPPANADDFIEQLQRSQTLSHFKYAVFGLGDVAYPHFCQFAKTLDAALQQSGAIRAINRVDADTHYQQFFKQWLTTLDALLAGDMQIGLNLALQVTPYSEQQPHLASICSIEKLNTGDSPVYQVDIDISDSGMHYRAGDLLYVLVDDDQVLLRQLADWFADDRAINVFANKELRSLNKALLRTLAKKSACASLKNKLKLSNKAMLAEYLYPRDLLDVLNDVSAEGAADNHFISIDELADALSSRSPRAYSIASCAKMYPEKVSLCIREVAYEFANRQHFGSASYQLSNAVAGQKIKVYTRSNPEFQLPELLQAGVIMIGAGTGVAPYIGFLQQLSQQQPHAENCSNLLFFGERYQQYDYLYQSQLQQWQKQKVLADVITTFSRDQPEKRYVQHALLEHGAQVWQLLQGGALLYVCGSRQNLAKAIDQALLQIAQVYGQLSLQQALDYLQNLYQNAVIRRDLY
ncbi:MAG: hypothetical protein OFPI_23510 [Osedax symbiont Rs2]|nr:MAG: hypothetical protein OFPI_23510 [Osedax symbiont Rs2]